MSVIDNLSQSSFPSQVMHVKHLGQRTKQGENKGRKRGKRKKGKEKKKNRLADPDILTSGINFKL